MNLENGPKVVHKRLNVGLSVTCLCVVSSGFGVVITIRLLAPGEGERDTRRL